MIHVYPIVFLNGLLFVHHNITFRSSDQCHLAILETTKFSIYLILLILKSIQIKKTSLAEILMFSWFSCSS